MTSVLALALGVVAFQADQRDTLVYNLALVRATRAVSVEARHTNFSGLPLALTAPPAMGRAETSVTTIAATDDRGITLPVRRMGNRAWLIEPREPGAIRFRYRVSVRNRIATGSTGAGFDSTRFYAVTAALFAGPDATALRKAGAPFPVVLVRVIPPAGWDVVTGLPQRGGTYAVDDGEELVGTTLAAAPDFRLYRSSEAGTAVTLAIRGHRYFTDSALAAVVRGSLRKGSEALGPVPVERVTYTSDVGRRGRTSGSLQGTGSIGLIWEPGELLERARTHDTFHETLHLWFGGAMEAERWWTEGVTDYLAARLYADWKQDPAELAALCFESYFQYLGIEHNTRLTMAQEARQGIGGDNTELLVYRKGMLAGLLLDAAIRRSTGGRASLDDVARRALELARTRRSRVVRDSELQNAVRDIGGASAASTWTRVVAGTEALAVNEVAEALAVVANRTFPIPERPKRGKVFDPTTAR